MTAALLRGVSPQNLAMKDLARCLERAGFARVKTVLSSGNAVFESPRGSEASLVATIETAMSRHLGTVFATQVRTIEHLNDLLASSPYGTLPRGAKRVVTFLREAPEAVPVLPIARDGVRIHACLGREVFTSYVPGPKGPVFMTMLEKTFGAAITTRTWETVERLVRAAA